VPRRRRKSKIAGAAVAAGHQRVQRLPSEEAGRQSATRYRPRNHGVPSLREGPPPT